MKIKHTENATNNSSYIVPGSKSYSLYTTQYICESQFVNYFKENVLTGMFLKFHVSVYAINTKYRKGIVEST